MQDEMHDYCTCRFGERVFIVLTIFIAMKYGVLCVVSMTISQRRRSVKSIPYFSRNLGFSSPTLFSFAPRASIADLYFFSVFLRAFHTRIHPTLGSTWRYILKVYGRNNAPSRASRKSDLPDNPSWYCRSSSSLSIDMSDLASSFISVILIHCFAAISRIISPVESASMSSI